MSRCSLTLLLTFAVSCMAIGGAQVHAATVWSGPDLSFTKADFADSSQAANQDRITSNVWITRGDIQGIYNAKTEASFSTGSPADTQWAWDLAGLNTGLNITATNFANLTFNSWRTATGGRPPDTVGIPGVLHLISDDIYIDIMFTSFTNGRTGDGGGFSYIRSTVPEPSAIGLVALASILVTTARCRRNR